MRIKVHEPQPLSHPKLWWWELVDDADRLLAKSPEISSEAECENAVRSVQAACKDIAIVHVKP
jgi:hypothetical protein